MELTLSLAVVRNLDMIGTIRIEGGIVMLSELCQIQKDKYLIFFYVEFRLKEKKDRAEEMVRFVKHLVHRHKGLDSVSSTREQTGHLWHAAGT